MEKFANKLSENIRFKSIAIFMLIMKALLIGTLIYRITHTPHNVSFEITNLFFYYIGVGFMAQLIDGALGMSYGATCTSMLMGVGVQPAYATASVHTAEVFTTGASGLSHIYYGNIDKPIFFRIVIPGVIGAMFGAYMISEVFNSEAIRPLIALYLMVLGTLILIKALKGKAKKPENKNLGILGLIGGFLDSIGGGGWGPLVSSNLMKKGNAPQKVIGTVNTAEFFVALFSTGIFLLFIDLEAWQPIAGLVIGGVVAAPLGAKLIKYIPSNKLMLIVGIVVILLSFVNLIKYF